MSGKDILGGSVEANSILQESLTPVLLGDQLAERNKQDVVARSGCPTCKQEEKRRRQLSTSDETAIVSAARMR